MDRDHEDEQGDDDRPGQRFPRMKAHRRPGRRRAAGVVDGMGDAEQARLVHPAVGPVKPGVVCKQVEQRCEGEIPQRVVVPAGVDLRPAAFLPAPGDDPCRNPVNRRRGERPADLAPDLRAELGMIARFHTPGDRREQPARRGIARSDDQRHRNGGKDDGGPHGLVGPCPNPKPVNRSCVSPRRPRARSVDHRQRSCAAWRHAPAARPRPCDAQRRADGAARGAEFRRRSHRPR